MASSSQPTFLYFSQKSPDYMVFEKGTETVGTVGGIITMIQMIPLVGAMIPTEIALKKNFDENGRRK